jgi:hypothetical protein
VERQRDQHHGTANTFTSFYHPDNPSLPERFSYNTIEFKSGPGFEYLFGKYLMLGISGGINTIASATFIAKEDHYHDAFVRTQIGLRLMVSFGSHCCRFDI